MSVRMRNALTAAALAAVVLGASACASRDEPVATIDWARTPPLSGDADDGVVRVEAPATGGQFALAVIEKPDVGGDGYAITGRIRYEGVEAGGFVQMWSEFADGGRYFSRTLGETGPQGRLVGSSGWRSLEVPFFLDGSPPPIRLEVGLVLAGSGVVEMGALELVPIGGAGSWWDDRTGGLVGGIGGSIIGLFGGLVGWLVARRRARAFTLNAMRVAVAFGLALLAAGAVAVARSQPYAVAYPLLLSGGIVVAIFGSALPRARRAYVDDELRRMRALDDR